MLQNLMLTPISRVYTNLLKTNHLNINVPQALESYNSWPVYHFLSAAMLAITNVGFTLVKYVPLVWLLFLILVTYSTGKRVNLAPNYCFLLSSLAVLSFWIGVNEYTPRLLGMILLLTIFMLILNPQKNIGEYIASNGTFFCSGNDSWNKQYCCRIRYYIIVNL